MTAASVALCIAGFVLLPQTIRGDDAVRVVMLEQMVAGVKPDTKYSFIQPLVSVPFYAAFDALHFGVFAVTLIPLIWLACWSACVWHVLARARSRAFAHHVVVLSVVSLLAGYVVGFGSDVFGALAVSGGGLVGLLGASRAGRLIGWVVLAIGAANTPVMFVAIALVAIWLVLTRRELRYLLLPAAVFGLMTVESTWVTGHLSWTRYSTDVEHGEFAMLPWGDVSGFGWPLWSGLLAVFFSFGRGLVFYIPQLWNGPSRSKDRVGGAERVLWVACAGLVPVYATWWAWYGGTGFGPRFFLLVVVPAAMAGASVVTDESRSVARSLVALAALSASLWVAAVGAVFNITTTAFDTCASGGGFTNHALCIYTPEYSGIWAPLWAADPVGLRDVAFLGALVLVTVPTVIALLLPCRAPMRRAVEQARASLRGPWRV